MVPDVVATAEYYHKTLGFRSDEDSVSPQYAVVWRDNAAIHFAPSEHAPAGVRIFFWVKDVNRLYDDVRARGAEVVELLGTLPYHIRDFSIRDPNGVELVCGQDWDD